ncbi:hypothetical protein [Actinokineospora cianjurensis]|uniref:Uncharacterized protein n=1 Tax=Actinokineospora cianjurensis TaxID=585224 RepID=A0A421B9V7_9PSEU|nr:hypothetical protein [Actinokineospora cianjurensis]RLK61221.1 hypothetical protein CLV68_1739 [Actinokineospora cianjurensis]
MLWGSGHDRLLAFVYRCIGCCVADQRLVSDLTVEVVASLHERPDLDDDADRDRVVDRLVTALTPHADPDTVQAAVRFAAWLDLVPRGGADPHAKVGAVRRFTRHLPVLA